MWSVASAFLLAFVFSVPADAAVTVTPKPASEPVAKDPGPPRGVCVGTEDECRKKNEKPDEKSGRLEKATVTAG